MEQFNSPIQGYDGWNVNSSYMTPSYMANFRPDYEGPGGRFNPYSHRTGIGESLWRQGPGDFEHGHDVLSGSSSDRYNIATGMSDAAMVGLQSVAIPASAWYATKKMGVHAAGTSLGSGLASGAMKKVGLGALSGSAGAIGGFLGAYAAPVYAGIQAASFANDMFMDPYVHTRRGMDAMMSNTANTAILGTGGSTSGGFGMSASRAQNISQALTVAGQKDLMLGGGDFNEIADNMMRAGIFQEVGDMDANKVVDGVKKATSVLKMIQRITGDPDIKAGIQTLATLKSGGLDDIHQMGLAIDQLRNHSAVSGIGMTQLLNTIGNQGAVMAQQQGISATTGLLASSDAFAGFTNARRSGLISGVDSAMLGGTEGMTQNMMGGAYTALNSGMARMALQGGGGLGGNLASNILKWGAGSSMDPINSQGDWYLNQQAYKDKAMQENGAGKVVLDLVKARARSMGFDDTDDLKLAMAASSLGISPEQFRSVALSDRAKQDPSYFANIQKARSASARADRTTQMQNNNQSLQGVPLLGDLQQTYNEVTKGLLGIGAEASGPFSEASALLADKWNEGLANIRGFQDQEDQSFYIGTGDKLRAFKYTGYKDVTRGNRGTGRKQRIKSDQYDNILSRLNGLEGSNDPEVRKKASSLRKAVTVGDYSSAAAILKDIDSKGQVTGFTKDDFRRTDARENLISAFKKGLIQSELVGEVDNNVIEKTLKGKMFDLEGLEDSERSDAITALIDKDMKGMMDYAGLSEGDMEGSDSHKRAKLLKTLMNKKVKYGEIDNAKDLKVGGVSLNPIFDSMGLHSDDDKANEKQLMKRLSESGISPLQLNSYMHKKNIDISAILNPLKNTLFSKNDTTEQYRELIKGIRDNEVQNAKDDADKPSDVKWDDVRTVTQGLVGLGRATEDNTKATQENTAVQVEMIRNSKMWGGGDITLESILDKSNKTPLVGNSVTKNPKK